MVVGGGCKNDKQEDVGLTMQATSTGTDVPVPVLTYTNTSGPV